MLGEKGVAATDPMAVAAIYFTNDDDSNCRMCYFY